MMNFFDHQQQSRRNTAFLVALFALAVGAIILAVYSVVMFFFFSPAGGAETGAPASCWFDSDVFLGVMAGVLMIVMAGSLFKMMALRRGGPYIAESLGGRRINPATTDPDEKKFINVVEEIAIAAGIPVPVAYLLEKETGINAFAAGYTPDDAVVAVTQGCLGRLTRDELQGVVAHEFSHILNGDMRLNIRLIAMISGILIIASLGKIAIRPGYRTRKNDMPIILAGLALVAIGYIGVFVSRIIQSAVSRQREYLADASAVQFTRNPKGIAGALKKIGGFTGGSRLKSPQAAETSHMFFSMAIGSIFATHPPLQNRIKRIDPSFDGNFSKTPAFPGSPASQTPSRPDSSMGFANEIPQTSVPPETIVQNTGILDPDQVTHSRNLLADIPPALRRELNDPMGASAVVVALLLDSNADERNRQMAAINQIIPENFIRHAARLHESVKRIDPALKLPLVDLSVPALRQMSVSQLQTFKQAVSALAVSDGRLSLFEYILQLIIASRVEAALHPGAGKPRFKNIDRLTDDAVILLSRLAIDGHRHFADAENAFLSAIRRIPVLENIPKDSPEFPRMGNYDFKQVGDALSNFAASSSGIKKTILDACAFCVLFDQRVTAKEAELLRAVAYTLDLPVPPIAMARGKSSR